MNTLEVNYEVLDFYKLLAGNHPKNCLFEVVFMFFSFRAHRAMFKLGGKKSFVYVSWLRMCQLFTVLTGVISKSLKKLSQT